MTDLGEDCRFLALEQRARERGADVYGTCTVGQAQCWNFYAYYYYAHYTGEDPASPGFLSFGTTGL